MENLLKMGRIGVFFLCLAAYQASAQTSGQVMFTGFSADGNDGFSFVTFVDIANGTNIRFNDNEWNGSAIGSGGAFNAGEGALTWNNNTGNSILAGTVIAINNSATTPAANLGTVSSGTISLEDTNEVLYMFLGTNASTPTVFLSAIANEGFSVANGQLTGTTLTTGVNAISFAGGQDVMIYSGSTNCTSTIGNCSAQVASSTNWSVQNTAANDATNGFPDFPTHVPCNFYGVAFSVVTYYSRNATLGGAWDAATSWTTNSDGSGGPLAAGVWPRRHDHVVILPGHSIIVNATNDNKSCGVTPDALLRPNVGPFAFSNIGMFYHTGDITIGGTFTVSGVEIMIEGYTKVLSGGLFSPTSFLVNLGYFDVDAGSSLTGFNSLVLTGNSITTINTTSQFVDDLIIDHTDATLCGTGSAQLQNGAGSVVTTTNGGTLNQICNTFTITCTGVGCSGFPVTGTGSGATGNTGPGGVGNFADNSLWLRANAGTSTTVNGTAVSLWTDQSGNTNHATQSTVSQRPLYQASVINGMPTLLFDNVAGPNNDELVIADNDNLDNTSGLTILSVTRPTSLGGNVGAIISKRNGVSSNDSYSMFYYTGNQLHLDVDDNNNRFNTSTTFATNTNYIANLYYDGSLAAAQRTKVYINGGLDITATETSTSIPNYASTVTIGSLNVNDGRAFGGHIAEVIVYRKTLNDAQRIIADNYLSAKYNIAIPAAVDVYTMDNAGNGNYDFEVAGIGQAPNGSNHINARGSGIVRMVIQSPSSLTNNEFLLWGHDNGVFTATTSGVDGSVIQERLTRIWRAGENSDVGSLAISFDLSSFHNPVGANLRLLIDRDGDGFTDNDITPISGVFTGNILTFSGVNLQNGDRFTIGNTDLSTPLPIELLSFSASSLNTEVQLNWVTASELNNDYFLVQRSKDAEAWQEVHRVTGAGTRNTKTEYQLIDASPLIGTSYYRLKQVDFDGQFSYSQVRRVDVSQAYQLKVYPNPSKGSFLVSTGFELAAEDVRFMDVMGKEISTTIRKETDGVSVETQQISPGIYVLQVHKGFWKQSVRVVIY